MMNVNENSDHINWDKLLDVLDGAADASSLSDDELAMLASAREMRARMKADRFSEEEGWQRFQQARNAGGLRVHKRKMTRLIAAASLLLMLGAGIWLFRPVKQPVALTRPEAKVILKRADGTVVTLDNSTKQTQRDSLGQITVDSSALIAAMGKAEGDAITTNTLEVPRGGALSLQLRDGTNVTINGSSKMSFPSAFTGDVREVYVEGEAFFDVTHDEQHPFIVHAGNVTMKVLGTAFNVHTSKTGVTATLTKGRLQVSAGGKSVVITPGEQAVYTNDGVLNKHVVDTRLYTAWSEGELYFDDESLSDIMSALSRSYDVDIIFDDPALANMRFTLDMRRPKSVEDVLDQIAKSSSDIHFSIDGPTVHVAVSHKK